MNGPHVTLNLTDLSALAGWGDGDVNADAASVVVNALTSLERRMFVLAEYAHEKEEEHLAGVLHCEATRLGSLSVLLAKLIREQRGDEPDAPKPASPQSTGYAKAAASAHSEFHRAVAKAELSHLFTRWLEAETRLATSLEVDATTTTGAPNG